MVLADIQKKKFLETSGKKYIGKELKGSFSTKRPYNDEKWEKYSPWLFSYVIEPETGNLICELEHRMTNNRIYGWDKVGNELENEIIEKYFIPHW
ncbi:MAG: hypothetical protein ACQEWG_06090 [Bacteroidota bacterium]